MGGQHQEARKGTVVIGRQHEVQYKTQGDEAQMQNEGPGHAARVPNNPCGRTTNTAATRTGERILASIGA